MKIREELAFIREYQIYMTEDNNELCIYRETSDN